ncbi:MAG: hypothetical protein CL573_06475 [Alphaproteobacteria bacterium]|nr:hypothetical protein [Alphaproteobacteria bacterium]HCP00628.1 hypothetical protein [Rhodospirillaceae bacterium]
MHLMVILEDRISEWESKGEILEGYFNPAGAFETVTVFGLVADQPDVATLERLCAPACHQYINAGIDRRYLMLSTAGLRPELLFRRLRRLTPLVPLSRPDVIRGYGDGLAAVAAAAVSHETGTPFAVSVHMTADVEIQARYLGAPDRLWRRFLRSAVNRSFQGAGSVMAAYAPILEYLPPSVTDKAIVVPNVVGISPRPELQTRREGPMRALWLGRQMPGRDPRPILEALDILPTVHLTLIGDGPLHDVARRCATHLADRTRFVRAMDNRKLCASLGDYDVLVVNSGFREMPKTVMEAALAGLPIIVNRLPAVESLEYSRLPVVFVDPNSGSYASALRYMEDNPQNLEAKRRETQDAAWQLWDPQKVATKTADVLRSLAMKGI